MQSACFNLSRSSIVAIGSVQKIITFVCERSDLEILDMMLEMSQTEPYRGICVVGRFGMDPLSSKFCLDFTLKRKESGDWVLNPKNTKIEFYARVRSTQRRIELLYTEKGEFEVYDQYKEELNDFRLQVKNFFSV